MRQFACFQLDTQNECLWRNGDRIPLTPKPFAVLRYLVEHPQRLVTHDELLEALWPETYVQPQVLRTYVLELRKVLGDDAGNARFIETVPKRGYRFIAGLAESAQSLAGFEQKAGAPPSGLVGRAAELGEFHRAMTEVLRAERQILFVTGEVGIGKTFTFPIPVPGLPGAVSLQVQVQISVTIGGPDPNDPMTFTYDTSGLRALEQSAGSHAKRERAIGLAVRDLGPHQAGAVLRRRHLDRAADVENGDDQRLEFPLHGLGERGVENFSGDIEGEGGHGDLPCAEEGGFVDLARSRLIAKSWAACIADRSEPSLI